MFELFAFAAIFVLFIQLSNTRGRLQRAEGTLQEAAKRIGALQRLTGMLPPKPGEFPETQSWPEVKKAAVQPANREAEPEPMSSAPEQPEQPSAMPMEDTGDVPETLTQELEETENAEGAERQPDFAIDVPAEPGTEPTAELEPIDPVQVEDIAPEPVGDSAPEPLEAIPEPPQDAAPPRSMASRFEELFGKQLPIWAGGITLAIAGVLIVKYAIDAGFFGRVFTHGVQIVTGLLFGAGLIAGAEFAWRNEDKVRDVRVPQALSGAGIATLYASVLVAANAYQLIGPLAAFIALAAITASALGLSLRFGAPSALLGLAGGLAAPAMVGSLAPNVPLLAVYLGLTIAGLTGVSRMRRWPWLALAALLGGAGWSLWMILASNALDTMASISIGGFVLLLAIALPMLALNGPRAAFLRSITAIVGAAQLALLVAHGGFIPLHWGLFALLAAAGQWLAWRDRNFAIVPTISLALSGLLLGLWPEPSAYWFALIGLSLAAIHAGPLLARLWQVPPGLQRTLELCGLALAAPVLTKWHFWQGSDDTLALVALGAAALTATAIAMGWRRDDRFDDNRFALLTATTGTLVALATVLVLPDWQAPLGIAALAAALLLFGKVARDLRIESIAAAFALVTLPALLLTMAGPREIVQLILGTSLPLDPHALLRGGGLVLLFALFAWQAVGRELRFLSLAIAGALTYGTLAQAVPGWSLPLVMAAVALVLFGIAQHRASGSIERLAGFFAAVCLPLLAVTGPDTAAEWSRLLSSDAAVSGTALLRWGGVAALFALFAWRGLIASSRLSGHSTAALLAYGLMAQFIPGWSLPLAVCAIAAVLLLVGERGRTDGVRELAILAALAVLPVLVFSAEDSYAEWSRLGSSDAAVPLTSALRWGMVAVLYALFGWRGRADGLRLAGHVGAAILGYGFLAQIIPGWSLPIASSAIAAVLVWLGLRGQTPGVGKLAVIAAVAALPVLVFSAEDTAAEWSRLWGSNALVPFVSALRWGAVALLAVLFAARSPGKALLRLAAIAAALLGYGAAAQLISAEYLPLVPAIGGAALLLATTRFERERLYFAAATFAALSLAWAAIPLVLWSFVAARSLGGVPMILDPVDFTLGRALKQLLAPALLFGGALWHIRAALNDRVRKAAIGLCAIIAGIALHWLYRLGFATAFGADFIETGLAQRLVWAGLLIGGGWLALLRQRERLAFGLLGAGTAHALWYTLLLHNPLWSAQAVGSIPLANLLIPTFAAVPLGIALLCRMWQDRPAFIGRIIQPCHMLLVCGFAWATLRQAFHGTLLVTPGVFPTENILRSILFLALAIGFLLWGIRAKRHDWRIASLVLMLGAVGKVFLFDASGLEGLLRIGSFVALGFSLIGIGWLYSRQLAKPAEPEGHG